MKCSNRESQSKIAKDNEWALNCICALQKQYFCQEICASHGGQLFSAFCINKDNQMTADLIFTCAVNSIVNILPV